MSEAQERPGLSLIMCTIGQRATIGRLIDSLESQVCKNFELVIVDQNPPGTLDQLVANISKRLTVQYVRSEQGLSRSRNVGLRVCHGGILAFPDDDCWYPVSLVQQVIEIFGKEPTLSIATGRTTDAHCNDSNGRFLRSTTIVTRANVWYAGNSNSIFARREVCEATGNFDETLGAGSGTPFGAGEESDFLLRAINAGFLVKFFHALVVHHDQVNTSFSKSALEKATSYAVGFGRILRLHRYSLAYVLFRAARSWIGALLALGTFNTNKFRYKLIWVTGTLRGFFAPMHIERSVNRQLHKPTIDVD